MATGGAALDGDVMDANALGIGNSTVQPRTRVGNRPNARRRTISPAAHLDLIRWKCDRGRRGVYRALVDSARLPTRR